MRALVFSGGGARGAYEAGVVRYLTEELPRRLGRPVRFDLHCGTSVGAIHACYMASTAHEPMNRGSRLVDMWSAMRVDEVFPLSARDLLRLPRRIFGLRRYAEALRQGNAPERLYGLLDTSYLERVVLEAISWSDLRNNVKQGLVRAVCVAATQIATGRVVVFIASNQRQVPMWGPDPLMLPRITRLLPVHALASASIPLLFPAVRIGSTYYADGGLRLNTPLAPALRLGADRVLVVALRQSPNDAHDAALSQQRIEDYASPLFLFGKVLNALLLDPIDTDLARMRLMNSILDDGEEAFGNQFIDRINAVASREQARPFKKIEDVVIRPSTDLGILAGQVLQNMPDSRSRSPLLRLAARNLTGKRRTPEADLLSYLLFDGEFLGPLAELGYADARAMEEQLAEFFSDDLGSPVRGAQLARQWQLIQRLARSRGGARLDDLADELECVRRTVYRDLEALMLAGFPVVSEMRDGRAYYRFLDSFRIGDVPFTPDEILALAFGEDLLRTLEGTVFHDSIRSALGKIRAGLGPELSSYLARLGESFRVLPGPYKNYARFRDTIQVLNDAVLSRQTVRMRYRTGGTGAVTTRNLDPYRVWYRSGGLYVVGFDHRTDEVRTFAVDRIRRIEATKDRFALPADFDFDQYIGSSFGVIAEPAVTVRIRFDRRWATFVEERTWHTSQSLEPGPDDSVVLTMEVGGTAELRQWILSFGSGAEILEPEPLRKEVTDELKASLQRYARAPKRRGKRK